MTMMEASTTMAEEYRSRDRITPRPESTMTIEELRSVLDELGLTQAELAHILGISERTMRRYLTEPQVRKTGKRARYHPGRGGTQIPPPAVKLIRLILAKKVTLMDVFTA